jgi:hypothetical protein
MEYLYKENLYKSIKYDFSEEKPKSVEEFLEIFEDIKYDEFEAKLMLDGSEKREIIFSDDFATFKRKIIYTFVPSSNLFAGDNIIQTLELDGDKKWKEIHSKYEFSRRIFDNILFEKMFDDFIDVKLDLDKE